MKRILSLLISVFVGLWASTASAETVQELLERLHAATDGTMVRLHAQRSPQRYLTNSGDQLSMPVPEDKNDPKQLWILRPSGEGFTLQNSATAKYLKITTGENAPKTSDDASVLYIRANTVSTSKTGLWVNISSNADFSGKSTLNMNANNNETLYIWELDEGGIWTIEEVEEVEPVAPEEGKTYYLHSMVYDRYMGESSSHQIVTTENIGKNIFPVFTFEKSGDGFLIKSVVTGRYIAGVSALSQQYTTVASGGQVFVPERVPHAAWFFKQEGKNYGLHVAESNSYNLVSWTNTTASVLYLEPAEVSEEEIEEMRQIYKNHGEISSLKASDFTGLFTDNQATELTDEYKDLSDEDFLATEKVSALPQPIKEWLLKLKNDTWDPYEKKFRIRSCEAVSDHDYWANKVNITAFSPMYNPTGITLQNGETAIIWVKNSPSTKKQLRVEGHTSWQDHNGKKQQDLKVGFNLFVATADNMQLYIDYRSRNNIELSRCPDVDVQIVGGKVNGYFDARNWTNADWVAMKKAGLFTDPILDVVGEMVQWRVKSADVVPGLTKPVDVMKNWDYLIGLELDLMGLTACPDSLKALGGEEVYEDYYPKRFNNRMLCFYNGNGGNPYSTYACTYYTSADCFTDRGINRSTFDLWTGGHEIGHNLQPAINLASCTEVSNNLFSGMVAHHFGKVGRSVSMSKLQERLASGNNLWLDNMGDVFHLNHMYYGLYLYYHAAGHNRLFWPKMFRLLRRDPLVNHNNKTVTADQDYLKFALKACEAAGEDLTEYFDLWGFFIPFSGTKTVTDYTATHITVTQAMINNVKEQMAKYPKANPAIMFIDDFAEYNAGTRGTMDDYRSNLKKGYIFGDYLTFIPKTPSQPHNFLAFYNQSNGLFTLPSTTNADGVAGIKVYDNAGKLIYIGNTRRMTIPASLRNEVASFKISLPDGTEMPLYTRADTTDRKAVQMTIYSPEHYTGIVRYTNGEDEAMRSDLRDGVNALAVVKDANLDEAAPTMRTAKNVIVTNGDATPQAANIELSDNDGLHIPFEFMAAQASYSRTGTGASFNTVVLPFDMPKTAFGEGAILEDVDRIEEVNDEVKVYFKAITDDVIAAGRPVVVYNPATVNEWTSALTQQSNVMVVPALQSSEAAVRLVGSYKQSTIGAGNFKLNLDGTAQEKSDATTLIEPFRAYLQFATAPEASSITLVHVDGAETGITDVAGDILDNHTPVYDLQGRRVFKPQVGGIYVQNGKKVVVLK